MAKYESAKGEIPLKKRDICAHLQHEKVYASGTKQSWNKWTRYSQLQNIIYSLWTKNQQVLLMQCTVYLLWCKRSVKLYGLQGAHVRLLMLNVCIYKLSVLICAKSFCG